VFPKFIGVGVFAVVVCVLLSEKLPTALNAKTDFATLSNVIRCETFEIAEIKEQISS
jgi:hypothetical protein